MSSEVTIYNLALSHIRAGQVSSMTEATLQRQQCSLKYPFLRDRCLREGSWGFCRTIEALALTTEEIFNYVYAYSYPVDCLKIHRLVGEYEEADSDDTTTALISSRYATTTRDTRAQIPYEVFNFNGVRVIGCNYSSMRIDYAAKIEDPTVFSDDFVMALSHLLASEIAVALVGGTLGREFRKDELSLYIEYINTATAADVNERYLDSVESEFVTVRQ